MPRVLAALLAGVVAIVLNTAALAAADLVLVATAHGGLLRLLVILTGGAIPAPVGGAFEAGFHIVVGLAMALFYAFAVEPVLRGPNWLRGLLYGVAAWLAQNGDASTTGVASQSPLAIARVPRQETHRRASSPKAA
jgi:hypothetical protein